MKINDIVEITKKSRSEVEKMLNESELLTIDLTEK